MKKWYTYTMHLVYAKFLSLGREDKIALGSTHFCFLPWTTNYHGVHLLCHFFSCGWVFIFHPEYAENGKPNFPANVKKYFTEKILLWLNKWVKKYFFKPKIVSVGFYIKSNTPLALFWRNFLWSIWDASY